MPARPRRPLLLLLLAGVFTNIHAAVLSSSRLESCVRGGTQGAAGGQRLQCDKKLVLAVTVGGGQALATEQLQLDLRCIGR